jgi:hypothetical protein
MGAHSNLTLIEFIDGDENHAFANDLRERFLNVVVESEFAEYFGP